MRRMEDELQVDDCDSDIREQHKLGPTNMVNISIYSQPELRALLRGED